MEEYKYLKYKYKYQQLLAKMDNQQGGVYLYDEFATTINMSNFKMAKQSDNHYTLVSSDYEELYNITDIKKLTAGLSGDNVYLCMYKNSLSTKPVRSIFKLFSNESNAKAECESIKMFNKIGLGAHFSTIRLYGKITDVSQLYKGDKKPYYFIISDFIDNISMQDIISSQCCYNNTSSDRAVKSYCEKYCENDTHSMYEKIHEQDNGKKNMRMILLQLFYIIYIFKLNGISHCDFHGDNILVTPVNKPFYIKIFDKEYEMSDFKVMVIDLDTVSNVKLVRGRYVLCPDWKSNKSGVTKKNSKSNNLLISCSYQNAHKEYSTNTIMSSPVGDFIDARINPVDGDMWHFKWILKILNETYSLGIDIPTVNKLIDALSQDSLNTNIPERNKKNLIIYYLKFLYILTDIIFYKSNMDIAEFEKPENTRDNIVGTVTNNVKQTHLIPRKTVLVNKEEKRGKSSSNPFDGEDKPTPALIPRNTILLNREEKRGESSSNPFDGEDDGRNKSLSNPFGDDNDEDDEDDGRHKSLSNPSDRVKPVTDPFGKVKPVTDPFGEVKPVTNPVDKVKPVTNPVDKVKPVTDPFGEVKPVTNPVDKVKPVTDPFGEVKPVTDPFGEVKPVTNPVDEVKPVTNPFGKVKPVTNAVDEFLATEGTDDQLDSLLDNLAVNANKNDERDALKKYIRSNCNEQSHKHLIDTLIKDI